MTSEVTSEKDVFGKVAAAETGISRALQGWDAVDLAAIGQCMNSLELSVGELAQALETVRESPAGTFRSLSSRALDIKKAASSLERLVDSSAAFLRGAPGLAADEPGIYQHDGLFRTPPPAEELELRG